jgi:hypothetical protein
LSLTVFTTSYVLITCPHFSLKDNALPLLISPSSEWLVRHCCAGWGLRVETQAEVDAVRAIGAQLRRFRSDMEKDGQAQRDALLKVLCVCACGWAIGEGVWSHLFPPPFGCRLVTREQRRTKTSP